MEKITWRWRGREVHHPLAKFCVAMGLVVMMPISLVMMMVTLVIGIITLPITIPLHFALKAMGRKGFVRHEVNRQKESIQIVIDHTGFQKA